MVSYSELTSLKGRVALVTGGAGAVGRSIADAYAELGAAVAILDRPGSAAEAVARALTEKYGVLTTVLMVDLADAAAVRKVPQRVVDSCGRLDILVANTLGADKFGVDVGEAIAAAAEQPSPDDWRAAMDVGLTAPLLLMQQAIPALRASGRGAVINIAAGFGVAASRGGLVEMTRWFAAALAPQVRVNAIVAGAHGEAEAERGKKRGPSATPLQRAAPGDDVKGAAVFLASDLSAHITGQCLTVDGGRANA